MKKKIEFEVIGATRPETVKSGQTSFVAILTSKSGHGYQVVTSKRYDIGDTMEFEVDTTKDVVTWPSTVLFARKTDRVPKQVLEALKTDDNRNKSKEAPNVNKA